ncbi:hypothetical protein FHG87_011527 [Trinorchestia longiramus]|nr:hypothetical protein FHG87_011527 [Trinorchestia longiramus]
MWFEIWFNSGVLFLSRLTVYKTYHPNTFIPLSSQSVYRILLVSSISPQTVNKDEGGPRVPVVCGRRGPRRAQWWTVRRAHRPLTKMKEALAFLLLVAVVVLAAPNGGLFEERSDDLEDVVVADGDPESIFCVCGGICAANGTFGLRKPVCWFGTTAFPDVCPFCNCCVFVIS